MHRQIYRLMFLAGSFGLLMPETHRKALPSFRGLLKTLPNSRMLEMMGEILFPSRICLVVETLILTI